MNDYKLKVDPDSANDDMSCNICKELMVDACHSVCGCQYCRKCIYGYVGDGDKYCPGAKTKCKDEYLSLDKDVVSDRRMNNKIFKSKVLCPNESCKEKIELAQIHEHFRVCSKQSTECPYATIGCDNGEQTKDTILTHLNNETLPHAQLLLDYIRNLKNDVDVLQSNSEINKAEIVSLKNDVDVLQSNSEINKAEIVSLKEELRMKDTEMGAKAELNRDPMDQVSNLKKRVEFVKEYSQLQEREAKEELFEGIKFLHKEIIDLMNERERELIDEIEIRTNAWIKSCPNADADFAWKIDELTNKRKVMTGKGIYSEPFYSNDYKLCLRLCIWGDDNIRLSCRIMKGDNDDNVQWPMRHKVTLSIINQDTLEAFNSVTIHYDTYKYYKSAYDRPMNEMHDHGIGTYKLIKYSSIKDIPSIINNDSFVVSCILTDP